MLKENVGKRLVRQSGAKWMKGKANAKPLGASLTPKETSDDGSEKREREKERNDVAREVEVSVCE